MRWPRFTLLQLFLATALCGLLAGWLTQVWQAGAAAQLAGMEISPDGKWLAARYLGGETKVWDISGPQPREVTNLPLPRGPLMQMRFTLGDALLVHAAGGRSSELVRIDLKTGRATTLIRSSQPFYTWAASQDGTTAVTCGAFVVGVKPTYDVWDLAAKKHVGRHALPISGLVERLEIDGRGSTLVVSDVTQTNVWACDVETGNVVRTVPSLAFSRWSLSGDGTLWTFQWPAIAGGTTQPSIEGLDLRDGNRAPTILEAGGLPLGLYAPQDGSRILVCSHYGVELWDAKRKRRLWAAIEPMDTSLFSRNVLMLRDAWRMSSDGSRIVTTSGMDQIRVLDGRTGQSLFLVGGINRLAYTTGYAAGFIVWAIAWGLLSRRQRLKEVAAGSLVRPKSLSTWPRTSAALAALTLLIVVVAVQLASAWAGGAWGGLFWLVPLAALGVLALIVLRVVWALVHPLSYARDQARLLTGERGRRDSQRMIHGWFLGRSTIEDCFRQQVEEVRRQASAILGREIQLKYLLLVIGVQRQEQFDRLHRSHVPHGAITVQRWGLDEVRIGEETCTGYAIPPCQGLRHAAALALLRRYWHSDVPQWLSVGLVNRMARDTSDHDAELARNQRFLRGVAGDRLEELWNAAFEYTPQQWRGMILGKEDPQQLQAVMEASALFVSLSAYFLADDAGPRREQFLAFVRGIGHAEDADAAFVRVFGHPPRDLYAQWRKWLDQQPPGALEPPREEVSCAIRGVLLPTLVDSGVSLAERRRCIVVLGGCGDLAAVRPLIEILEDEDEDESDLAAEALWALRGISGRAASEDPVSWRSWLAATSPQNVFLPTMAAVTASFDERDAASAGRVESRRVAWSLPQLLARAPTALRWSWFLWAASGIWGIAFAVAFSFYMTAWMVLPIYGITFVIGLIALVRGSGRHWWGIQRLPRYQTAALLGCDPLSAGSGMIAMGLLNTRAVRDFLSAANDASFRSR